MAQGRPDIPTALKREVLVEAGHRCAIPVCRQHPVELAHITPWAKVQEHTFDNLIALCPTCHTRYDKGDIDRRSMLRYKTNLEVMNHRYTDIERQLLKAFIRNWQQIREHMPTVSLQDVATVGGASVRIYADMWWTITNLLDDGVVIFREEDRIDLRRQEDQRNARVVLLTDKGRDFLVRWIDAEPI